MTKEALLKASIREFEDFRDNAYVYNYDRVLTNQGFSYIVIDNTSEKKISCAIHVTTEKTYGEDIGRTYELTGFLSTRKDIASNQLVVYKDYYIFTLSHAEFNATMGQYGYSISIVPAVNLILTSELSDTYGSTCYDLISSIPNWTILPQYYPIEDYTSGVVLLSITNSETQSLTNVNKTTSETLKRDSVKFSFVNITRHRIVEFVRDLQNYSLSSQTYGIVSTPKIIDRGESDEGSALQTITTDVEVDVSYVLVSEIDDKYDKIIKTVIYKMEDTNGLT